MPTDISPAEVFKAIGRLRKAAIDEIDRLIRFLDETENHMAIDCEDGGDDEPGGDDELSLGCQETVVSQASAWNQPTDYHFGDCEHDDCDDGPSLGSKNVTEGGTQAFWGSGDIIDLQDEHDGAEPFDGDDEPSTGFDTGAPSLG